jgi:hypothetical protein
MKRLCLPAGFLFVLMAFLQVDLRPSDSRIPERQGEGLPQEWIQTVNRTAPGDNWKSIEAASLSGLIECRRLKTGTDPLDTFWVERGPANIPGRITDLSVDYASGRIYALTDHGMVFRGTSDGPDWIPLNDQFPLAQGVASFMDVIPGGNHLRIIVAGWQKTLDGWGVFLSDDDGASWRQPEGLFQYPVSGIRRGKVTDDAVYLFVQEYEARQSTDYYTVYQSTDRGSSFEPLYRSKIRTGDGARNQKSDMWVSDKPGSTDIFLALEDSLFVVNSLDGSRIYRGQISGIASENGLMLAGAETSEPARLRVWVGDNGTARYYASDDGGLTWEHRSDYTDGVATYPFGYNSFSVSPQTGDTLYFGGVLAIRSTDGARSWKLIDMDPTNSYALYHGDVPKTLISRDPSGNLEVYFGTDGGMYRLDASHDHLITISVPGLNSTQIYKMSSIHNDPGKMFAGTQDNGYIKTLTGADGTSPADFRMVWGGDVTNLASGDGGRSLWVWWWGEGCNYVTVPETDFTISNYSPSWSNLECPYWEAPIWVAEQFPDQCFTAGRPKGADGSYLIRVQAQRNAAATARTYPFNFKAVAGDQVTAIAISPLDSTHWYVATANGYFFRSVDAGNSWSTRKLLSGSLYARAIFPSRKVLGRIWIGGSGYSNPAVYYTEDDGVTFRGLTVGMPTTIVEAFDSNPDESLVFAATGVAPMMLRTSVMEWSEIAGNKAPLVHYMDVEYIKTLQIARFATFARGIWDFAVGQALGTEPVEVAGPDWVVYPVPAHDNLTIEIPGEPAGKVEISLYNMSGQQLVREISLSNAHRLNTAGLKRGLYLLAVRRNGNTTCRKVLLQ